MKLRINGNSIRLRLLRSDVTTFIETGHIERKIYFSSSDHAFLIYALKHESGLANVELRHEQSEVIVVLPKEQAISWAETDQVGVYSTVDLGKHGSVEIIVEKDFACLDLSDADNHDTFQNPQIDTACI
ncbi:OB-fold nucleic acid binding domain-containing protein [Acidicapsa ligni]|uniref:OB-fold nucleic acid binding domain-containing protein n=1 Tax=Acidicapsa ligni TaxID=542300 RepID=UPI0021DF69C7|nr:OB-fold nucleic acid binding domain-containing protein [Acidicapsa ligni]